MTQLMMLSTDTMKLTPKDNNLKLLIRLIFIILFISFSVYILFVESERYESTGITLLKDLEKKQKISLSEMLLGQGSSTLQDSKVLELYIRSHEMYDYLDQIYHLSEYYSSESLDPIQRLYPDAMLPLWKKSKANLLKKYNEDLIALYDDPSGTLQLSFIYTNPQKAQQILQSIIEKAEETINAFARENAKIALAFIEKQRKEKRKLFIEAIKKLIDYQNKHHTIDPSVDVERKVSILGELETELIKNEVEYATKLKTFNPNSREVKILNENIRNLKRSISRVKKELSGNGNTEELNANVFEFELLKSDMEFAKEVYRQTLINQEEIKIEVAQKAKHLIIVAKPTLADDYSYPNKLWDIFTLLILLALLYGIITGVISIIENHKD